VNGNAVSVTLSSGFSLSPVEKLPTLVPEGENRRRAKKGEKAKPRKKKKKELKKKKRLGTRAHTRARKKKTKTTKKGLRRRRRRRRKGIKEARQKRAPILGKAQKKKPA